MKQVKYQTRKSTNIGWSDTDRKKNDLPKGLSFFCRVTNYVIKTKLMDYYDSSKRTLQIVLEDSKWLVFFIEDTVTIYGYDFLAR